MVFSIYDRVFISAQRLSERTVFYVDKAHVMKAYTGDGDCSPAIYFMETTQCVYMKRGILCGNPY
jgi:hypothetical protein